MVSGVHLGRALVSPVGVTVSVHVQPTRATTAQRPLSRRLGAASRSHLALPSICVLLDLTIVLATVMAAARLRQDLPGLSAANDVDELVAQIGFFIVLGWVGLLGAFGTYSNHQLSAGIEEYRSVVNASVVAAGAVGIVCYLAKIPLSRGFFVLTFLIGVPALVLGRMLLRRGLHAARRRGLFLHRVLVAGDAAHVDELTAILQRERWLGYHVVGALRSPDCDAERTDLLHVPYLGDAADAADVAAAHRADTLIVGRGAYVGSTELRRAQWALEEHRVQVIVAPSVTDVARERVTIRPVAGLPLVHLERPQSLEASRAAKRAFDVIGASLILLAALPVMAVAAIAVRRADGGPVLFRQERVGREGQAFSMLKLRTMVPDAEGLLADLRDERAGGDVLFKMADDPRVTRPGRWLRRTSIDELPQLVNVLRGEMSLVGPRPALPREVSRYEGDVSRRLRVRPGMTGLWQVSGRSDLSWEDTVRLDLYYVDNWSLVQDLTILARTLRAVVASDGAY